MDRVELARLLGLAASAAGPHLGPMVIEETEAERFMRKFTAAAAESGPVFLADPAWTAVQRRRMTALIDSAGPNPGAAISRGWLMIPSGGTGGELKLARHDGETISSAVRGFGAHFGVQRVNAVGVLPLHHVSGLMAWMRCALTGGEYLPWDWKRLEAGESPALTASGDWFLSLVPTQLQRLLALPDRVDWLRRFHAIFIGGGPAWPELTETAARLRLPLSLSYGMTETAAMVAAQRPADFLAGRRDCGPALPHARIAIAPDGAVQVTGASVFRGYWPGAGAAGDFKTEDLGRLDESGRLHIVGRRDEMIITGGKKVSPLEVEAALRATGEFADVAAIGVPDTEWGQIVVACHPAGMKPPDLARVRTGLGGLASHMHPKRYVAVAAWPRNAQGKLNRAALGAAVAASSRVDPPGESGR